jgi:hypothetical protein
MFTKGILVRASGTFGTGETASWSAKPWARSRLTDYHRKVNVLIRSGEGFVLAAAKESPKSDTQPAKALKTPSGGVTVP